MNKDMCDKEMKEILLMFSGGRDSMLAACRLVSQGYKVHLIIFDNGTMSAIKNIEDMAHRLVDRFEADLVNFESIQSIAADLLNLRGELYNMHAKVLALKYPYIILNQVNCLICHSVMVAHAIAYCKVNGISILAGGERKQQGFFIELPEMVKRYARLCQQFDIEFVLPVYELDSDIKRKYELADWGLLPKSYEAQCWIGCPLNKELTGDERNSLVDYYDNELKDKLIKLVQVYIRVV